MRERFIIKVPSSWFLQPIHRLLERDAYKLSEDADWAGGQFVVSYVFQPRHDYLTPAQARQLYKDYKTLRRKSFYRLWRSTSAEQSGRVP